MAVVEAIDGPFVAGAPDSPFVARPEASCVRALWDRVEAAVRETLGAVTLEDLRREAVVPGPADYTI
jgi:DNA-binding IscR family transcriptional regulator